MLPTSTACRYDSGSEYTFQGPHPERREPPVIGLGDSLLPAGMERSDAPLPAPAPTRPRPRAPWPVAAPRPVKPIDAQLAPRLATVMGAATVVTSTVLAFVYGIRLGDRHLPLPDCVISPGGWLSAPVFDPAVSDCANQYDTYADDLKHAEGHGLALWLGVLVGGVLVGGALAAAVEQATHATQRWAHRRQLRLAAVAPTLPAAPAPGIEMV